jgi:hypothetical protein
MIEEEAFMPARHAIFVAALFVGVAANRFLFPPMKAKAAPSQQASQTVDVCTLMEKIDVEALPRQDILSKADE